MESAPETRLSDVDGERGRLVIAGYDVESLSGRITFEGAVGLLWDGRMPDAASSFVPPWARPGWPLSNGWGNSGTR
jgi:citrate synthase